MWVRYNCHVAKHACENRAEWRLLQGKAAVRLSSYYQLACDYGTAVMTSWERGGVAPIYLCESHATQMGWSQSVDSNPPTEQPKRSIPSGGPADAQVGLAKKDLAVVRDPVRDLTSGDSAKPLVDKAVGNTSRKDFEAYGQQRVKPSEATEEKQAEGKNPEHLCASRDGDRCTCQATVHCPICGRWFCDAHAEDEKWHACALTI